MSGITVAERDGQVAAVKIASSPERVARLDHEASVLSSLDHPGVVQYLSSTPGFPGDLATRFVGPDNWHDQPPTDAESVLDATSKLAATVADLHTAGVAHGALCAEHVISGRDGYPILCGFADSQPSEPAATHSDAVDLGRLMHSVSEPLPASTKTEFLAIADDLVAGTLDPARATHRLDAIVRPSNVKPREVGVSRRVLIAAAVVVVSILGSLMMSGSATPDSATPAVAVATDTSSTTPPPTTVSLAETGPVATGPVATGPTSTLAAPPAGAPELDHNGRRYALGQSGDIAISGDWNCDGQPTPAVLRPSTGEVAIFEQWPTPAQQIRANSVTTIATAYRFEIDADETCPDLRVLTNTGSRLVAVEGS